MRTYWNTLLGNTSSLALSPLRTLMLATLRNLQTNPGTKDFVNNVLQTASLCTKGHWLWLSPSPMFENLPLSWIFQIFPFHPLPSHLQKCPPYPPSLLKTCWNSRYLILKSLKTSNCHKWMNMAKQRNTWTSRLSEEACHLPQGWPASPPTDLF